jgi:hypothetical protein
MLLLTFVFISGLFIFILCFHSIGFITDKQFHYILSYLLVLYQNMLYNKDHIVIFYLNIIGIMLIIICYEPITMIYKEIIR